MASYFYLSDSGNYLVMRKQTSGVFVGFGSKASVGVLQDKALVDLDEVEIHEASLLPFDHSYQVAC